MISAKMSNQDRIIAFYRCTLLLETEVRVHWVYDPSIIERWVLGCERGLLLACHRWVHLGWNRATWQPECLSVKVWVHFDLYLLSVSDYIVTSVDIYLIDLLDNEDRSSDWARMLLGDSWSESLIKTKCTLANVCHQVTLGLLIGYDYWETISKILIFLRCVGPWDLLEWLGHLRESLVETKSACLFSLIVIVCPIHTLWSA